MIYYTHCVVNLQIDLTTKNRRSRMEYNSAKLLWEFIDNVRHVAIHRQMLAFMCATTVTIFMRRMCSKGLQSLPASFLNDALSTLQRHPSSWGRCHRLGLEEWLVNYSKRNVGLLGHFCCLYNKEISQ